MTKRARPLFAGTLLGLMWVCAAPAFSQDALDEAYPLSAPAPIWTGAYIGVHAGGYFNDAKATAINYGLSANDSANGLALGLYGGYVRQFGAWVVGAEADWTTGAGSNSKDLFTVRGRVGYAFERFLVYGTAGWGTSDFGTVTVGGVSQNPDFSGLVFGGGVEARLNQQLSLRAEVIHFAPSTDKFDMGTINGTQIGIIEADLESTILRTGLAYHFN